MTLVALTPRERVLTAVVEDLGNYVAELEHDLVVYREMLAVAQQQNHTHGVEMAGLRRQLAALRDELRDATARAVLS